MAQDIVIFLSLESMRKWKQGEGIHCRTGGMNVDVPHVINITTLSSTEREYPCRFSSHNVVLTSGKAQSYEAITINNFLNEAAQVGVIIPYVLWIL